MEKKILIIIYTHGDEKTGEEVVKRLKKKNLGKFFDCLIANPKAAKKKVRFIESDLNRLYPGKKDSKIYEERLAYANLEMAKKYEFVIDVHEATSGTNDFIIIPREKGINSFPLDSINLDTVLFWPDPKGPIGQILDNSVELEFGVRERDRKSVIKKAEKVITEFIKRAYFIGRQKRILEKKFYYVYGKLLSRDFSGDYKKIKNFKKIIINNENFYPLLAGQYLNDGIICYKMKSM
jgi:hypothetical protein